MKTTASFLIPLLALCAAGCANIERSRDLANPAVPGKVLAEQVCSACHGVDGNTVSPAFPRLAEQPPQYIIKQLTDFRSHDRSDPPGPSYMWGVSRHLSDGQIAGLAEYFSKQTAKSGATADATLIAAGKEIYQNGLPKDNVPACSVCHGEKGQGNAGFPRLAYQHAQYVEKQLDVFQFTHARPGTPMEAVTHPLNASQTKALAAYLEAFPGAK